jgi:tRNA threonylcarbamoyladenosine biosynthesis protein TsaB
MFIALDAATDTGTVAVGRGNELVGEVVIGVHTRHAEALLPSLDFLLRTARVDRSAVRGVVVGSGPGSFTGLRIAAATARGLALGLAVPLHAFSTLAALALDVATDRAVCALLDARRGEVYAAVYRRAGGDVLEELMPPAALPLAVVLRQVVAYDPVYAGPGAERYAAELPAAPVRAMPRASALLRLAAAEPGAGRVAQPGSWEPAYLRASGAGRGVAG